LAAASPLFAAHRGFQVLQEPAHAAPDPKGPSFPESDHLLFASWPSRWERSGPSESNAHLEVYGLGCCPYTLHHDPPIFQGAEHESLRSLYAGEPATGCVGLFFVAMRVMVAERRISMYFNIATSAARSHMRRFNRLTVSKSTASASPAARSNTAVS